MTGRSDIYCTQPSFFSPLLSLLSLKQWEASDVDENNGKQATWMRRRRRNISVYIDSTGSRGRGWVIHLLHVLVEEGAKVENISMKYALSFRF